MITEDGIHIHPKLVGCFIPSVRKVSLGAGESLKLDLRGLAKEAGLGLAIRLDRE